MIARSTTMNPTEHTAFPHCIPNENHRALKEECGDFAWKIQ